MTRNPFLPIRNLDSPYCVEKKVTCCASRNSASFTKAVFSVNGQNLPSTDLRSASCNAAVVDGIIIDVVVVVAAAPLSSFSIGSGSPKTQRQLEMKSLTATASAELAAEAQEALEVTAFTPDCN